VSTILEFSPRFDKIVLKRPHDGQDKKSTQRERSKKLKNTTK